MAMPPQDIYAETVPGAQVDPASEPRIRRAGPVSVPGARGHAPAAGTPLTPFILALLAILAGAFVVFRAYPLPVLSFDDGAFGSLGNVLAPLVLVAVFIERAVEVVLTPVRGDESQRLKDRIERGRAAGDHVAVAGLEARLVDHRLGTRRRAFLLAVGMGVLASVLGLRGVGGLLAPEPAPGAGFEFFDIVLTGLVVGGGADGVHKVVKAVTDSMEMVSRRSVAG